MNENIKKQHLETEYHPITKKKIKDTYLDEDGRPHRVGEPAVITYNMVTGHVLSQTYYQHGIITRDDGPAIEEFNIADQYHQLIWLKDGKKHRLDGPAEITTDLITGVEFTRVWWLEDKMHRENGYAFVSRNRDTGEIKHESVFYHDKRQNIDHVPDHTL